MDVSIITINFNSSKYTVKCIESIISNTSETITYEIIIVDNASTKDDYEQLVKGIAQLKSSVPVTIYKSVINTGFGGGNMHGVHYATGKYYAFLNNDIILNNDCISICKTFLELSEAAVVAPMQIKENGSYMSSFDYFLTIKRELLGRTLLHKLNPKKYPDRKNAPLKPLQVDCVAGSFMFIDGNAFDAVGGFDTNIFLYYEETDLCYRILKNVPNGKCFLLPQTSYIHYSGTSTTKSIDIKNELKRSMLYVLKKHSSLVSFKLFEWFYILKWLFKTIAKPHYLPILRTLLAGDSPAFSMKIKQKISR